MTANSRALENPNYVGPAGKNWDLFLDGDNRIARVSDKERVRQKIRERLQTFLGEWFQDATSGFPWFQEVFVDPVNTAQVESLIKATILETDGVNELKKFEFEFDRKNRIIKVLDFVVDTIYGPIEVTI